MTPRHAPRGVAAITSRGCRRRANEDAVGLAGAVLTGDPVLALGGVLGGALPVCMVVADGMGGHPHGALASREAVAELMSDPGRLATPEGCAAAIRQAHLHLHELMLRRPETMTMGTTIAGIAVLGDAFCWFNVGDSRIYRLRDDRLEQLGHDDRRATGSPGAGSPEAGSPGDGSPGAGRSAHEILQCLGGQRAIAPIAPHTGTGLLLPGDSLLVCSDGLTDMVDDRAIAAVLRTAGDAAAGAVLLLQAAMDAGGLDNVSVVVMRQASRGAGAQGDIASETVMPSRQSIGTA